MGSFEKNQTDEEVHDGTTAGTLRVLFADLEKAGCRREEIDRRCVGGWVKGMGEGTHLRYICHSAGKGTNGDP